MIDDELPSSFQQHRHDILIINHHFYIPEHLQKKEKSCV